MTRDPRQPIDPDSFDDDRIGHLVRDAAAGWTMPPVRLDAPSWRERVRSPRARRAAAARGWFGRLGQAATAAVALTVAGALVAVVLTRPPAGPGKSPAPSTNATSGPTEAAGASALPKLMLSGELPTPASVVVQTEGGFYANVDLKTGSLGRQYTSGGPGNAVQRQADGSLLCLCVQESVRVNGTATVDTVTLERYGPDGTLVRSNQVDTFTGAPDPRDPPSTDYNYPPHVVTVAAFSADGRFGLVGWSLRDHPAWQSGILLVDLVDGAVLDRLVLPDVTTGDGSARRVVQAPRIVGEAGSGRIVMARTVETWSSPDPQTASVVVHVDVFTVHLDGRWANLAPVPDASDCGDTVLRAGSLGAGGIWIACLQYGSGVTLVRRFDGAGRRLDDVIVRVGAGISGDMLAVSADGSVLFAWDPPSATLTRIDLATGKTSVSPGGAASADGGPLTAFGDWLAPTAAAKSLLVGAIVVSPDGSRVYAIGVASGAGGQELTGSSGIFAFDATTLASVAHFGATADFVSLAVSADGRFVYATGLPGVDAAGRQQRDQGASITVFDATDGSVRLVAGELGTGMLAFTAPVLE